MRRLGNDQNAMREAGIVWVVRRIEADYLATAKFQDELLVESSIASLGNARMVLDQLVSRDREPVFRARVTAVCMNAAGKPVRLPAEVRALQAK